MVLVRRGRELLLARSPHFTPGMYSALAGFVEPGETLEECVHRETWEEVGITVKTCATPSPSPGLSRTR
uniref:NUDIX domain-containing protein n=1 Tax=Chromobacterium vaccinii TaxID=1108595 RepID=UPI0021B2008A|nr:NUDIX domain-containing protein [Chromobacterium vaccinii]